MNMKNIIDWAPTVSGLIVKAPQGDGGQCVDLAVLWCKENSLPRVWANAAQWADMYDPRYWRLIRNTPTNWPTPGALVLWGPDKLAGTGPDGHIAVCVAATPNRLLTLDQNYPTGSPVHYQEHHYNGVIGWLVPLTI